ncbi:MAG: hypothetical protein GJV46_10555 [Geobacter sp.]|nr:hypothetical protein [Geobacter sp.]
MIKRVRSICLLVFCFSGFAFNAFAADKNIINLVKPVIPVSAVYAAKNDIGKPFCENDLLLQKNGRCCPAGTNNDLWSDVCTPLGTIDDQIFNSRDITYYCPSADMFIVGDSKHVWFSCADGNSKPLYGESIKFKDSKFCRDHGYGYLLRIKPWGMAGCIKYGDSQGDGCIEAGTCTYGGNK